MEKFQEELTNEVAGLQETILSITQEIESPALLDPESAYDEIVQSLERIEKSIEQVKIKGDLYKDYETKFGFPQHEFNDIDSAEFNLYHLTLLWNSMDKWDTWEQNTRSMDFNSISVTECKKVLKTFEDTLGELNAKEEPNDVLSLLERKVHSFKDKIPCIEFLRTPQLKERHWRKIEEIATDDISHGVTLEFIEDRGVFEKVEEIRKVCDKAKSEGKLEDLMNYLEKKWESCSLKTENKMGCNVISSFSPIWVLIEESIEIIKVIGNSIHSTTLRPQIMDWSEKLDTMETSLERLEVIQGFWLDLEPVATTNDIKWYKPHLYSSYMTVSTHFKRILEKVTQEPHVVRALTKQSVSMQLDDIDDMFQQFSNAMESLLDPKRAMCPRLYFISDKEMITLYRNASLDIKQIEPYLRKMFKNVHEIVLCKNQEVEQSTVVRRYNPLISGIMSSEGEYVEFHRVMKARGQIDEWIKFLDHYLRTTLMLLCRDLKAKSKMRRRQFEDILDEHKYPYQVTAIIAHYFWCEELAGLHKKGLTEVIMDVHNMKKRLSDKLHFLTENIEHMNGLEKKREIAKVQHIMYWVEYLDNWEDDKQEEIIRYVWDSEVNEVLVQIDNDLFKYAYEYVGLTPIFQPYVIGGNPALAFKMALKYNLIIDASEIHTLNKLAKVFGTNFKTILCNNPNMTNKIQQHLIGSSMSGSWINMKNLDCVDQNDLTVIFQIMQRLRNARTFGSTTFQYNNREIKQLPTCQMIMSNEHIMGNLKFFGRPVNFREQDERTVLKYILLQKGCGHLETLDVLHNVVNDCTEVGIHGVFNRMIKATLKSDSTQKLDIIANFLEMSAFETDDTLAFIRNICQVYLPNISVPTIPVTSFDDNVDETLMYPSLQVYNAYKHHRFIAVIGEEQGCGKTFAISKVLEHKQKNGEHCLMLHPLSFGAKSQIAGSEVYTVSTIMGSFLEEIGNKGGTIHFCGGLDNEWKSCLETITADSPYMLLENGEYATLPDNLNFVFELTDLENELPENIAEQVTLITIPNHKIEISVKLFQTWCEDLTLLKFEHAAKAVIYENIEKFHILFCKSLDIMQRNFPSKLAPRFISATVSLLKFFNAQLDMMRENNSESNIIRAYLYSLVWSFSGFLLHKDRTKFAELLKDEVESSGYFTIQVEWDFLLGRLGYDCKIIPWNSDCKQVSFSKTESERNYVSIKSQEIALYIITQNIIQSRHCFLLGPAGCGKSTILQLVLERNSKSLFKDLVVFYMTASTTASEVEVLIVQALKRRIKPYQILLVLYNLDCNNVHHLELARSLCEGRYIYLAHQKQWISLSEVTVCIESSTMLLTNTPDILISLVSKTTVVCLEEDFDELEYVFSQLLGIFLADELLIDDYELGARVSKLLVLIYKDAIKISSLFTRHNIMRCFRGILKAHPERVNSEETLLMLVHLELSAEFKDCLFNEHLKKAYIDIHETHFLRLFNVTTKQIQEYDKKYILMFKIDEEEVSDEDSQASAKEMNFVEDDQLNEILLEAYPKIRGKLNLSSYDEKIVFSSDYKQYFINFLRALDADKDVILIGEAGVGKRSMARFSTLFMGLELITLDGGSEHWKETFRTALLDASKDAADMIIVVGPEYVSENEILSTISDIRAYGFSWNLITEFERKELLYAGHDDPFMSLFSKAKFEEMNNSLIDKVNHNLNFVFCMEDQTAMESMVQNYPFIMKNCVINHYTPWTDETMISIAEDRFTGLEADINFPLRIVARCCSNLHQFCRETFSSTTSSQFLEFVALFPEMYKDVKVKLLKSRESLQIGIEQTVKAQLHIDQLNLEIASKEPEIKKLMMEAEQLNKRLGQEKQNLEKASQSFRKKEAKARAKSEITQELAAETHQNLEQALPHLESSIEAINSIDKGEIAEMRGFKQVPELVLHVLEAVCILLGVKPDWLTAKNLLAEPSLIQQLIDYDKDNVSDAVLKRIRRYIENPKFIPDEVAKVSRACCSLCMWVRAIDYYAKIFKTIEPKRIKLLQAESELAEAMTSLRKETDRVTHIETTITNIQSTYAEKIKRKSSLETHIADLQASLERAEQLAYSLEEEHRKWKEQIASLDQRLTCLVGDCIIGGMIISYGGQFGFKERANAVTAWKEVCEKHRVPVSKLSVLEIFEPILISSYLRADTLPPFEYYQENCLIVQKSKKWILFEDPDNLAKPWIHQAEKSSTIIEIDLYDPSLVRKLKVALNKGFIFLIDNFTKDYPKEIDKLIQYEIYERLRVFVGLIGIPEKKKELKVFIGSQEITVNPSFKLYLRSESVEHRKELQEFLKIVKFKMSSELFEAHMLKLLILQDNPELEERRLSLRSRQFERKDKLEEEKEKILLLLYKAQGALLDDEYLIGNITEAKASVVVAMNAQHLADEESQEVEAIRSKYMPLIRAMKEAYVLTEKLLDIDPVYYFSTVLYSEIMKHTWRIASSKTFSVEISVEKVLPQVLSTICTSVTEGLHTVHKLPYLLLFVIKVIHQRVAEEEQAELLQALNNFILSDLTESSITEADITSTDELFFKTLASVRLNVFLKAIQLKYIKRQPIFTAIIIFIETEFRRAGIDVDIPGLTKRIRISLETRRPILIIEHGSLDIWWIISKLAASKGNIRKPRLLVMGSHLNYQEINNTMQDCKNSRRWLIMQGLHNQIGELEKIKIPPIDDSFMVFATIPQVIQALSINYLKI
jgi:dynein heavy chain